MCKTFTSHTLQSWELQLGQFQVDIHKWSQALQYVIRSFSPCLLEVSIHSSSLKNVVHRHHATIHKDHLAIQYIFLLVSIIWTGKQNSFYPPHHTPQKKLRRRNPFLFQHVQKDSKYLSYENKDENYQQMKRTTMHSTWNGKALRISIHKINTAEPANFKYLMHQPQFHPHQNCLPCSPSSLLLHPLPKPHHSA